MRLIFIFSLLWVLGCSTDPQLPSKLPPVSAAVSNQQERSTPVHHPAFDLSHWSKVFPLAEFEKQEGRRKFDSTEPGDPLDLWKAHGRIISSPADLAMTEQVRSRTRKSKDLGEAVPVDVFLWEVGTPKQPYLTKIGGVPHRPKDRPWPTSYGKERKPLTFVAQICFLDSQDIVPERLPGDVLLIFFLDKDSYFNPINVHFEWSSQELAEPMTKDDCPAPSFPVPELAGVIHRSWEYPEAENTFYEVGHYQHWLLATTQSTKIGRSTWFIQGDPRHEDEELLCTFNSLSPSEKWPFTNRETLKTSEPGGDTLARDLDALMFGDVGCFYFLIDRQGQVRWEWDCY